VRAPLRVLYTFPTRLGTPGIGTTAWHQVAGLIEQGTEVTLACGSLERPLPGLHRHVETMRLAGVRVPYRVLGLERGVRRHDLRTARLVSRTRPPFDVVHCWPLGAERTLAAARAAGTAGVLERPNAHTAFAFEAVAAVCARLGIEVDPDSPHAFDAARLAREEREYAAAGQLLCPSEFVRETFLERGFEPERLLRHRYGFDPKRFSPPAEQPAGPFSVAFVGRGEPRKGLHLALRAWLDAGLGDQGGRFVICGGVEPAYRVHLAPLLAHPSVEETGPVPDPAAVMRACHALVLPSFEEGSALVTYEARACGCVLVISDRTGAPAEAGVDALVHRAGDQDGLERDLLKLAGDSALLARVRASSLARLDELTWSAAGARLVETYEEALGRRPRPASATPRG
jgi:glycosyltransferase involved in cell wall biosynthesis